VSVTTPMAARAPLPTKFAVAEKHMGLSLLYVRRSSVMIHAAILP
jgi:hypothetical protein